jgi:hypothetical protein
MFRNSFFIIIIILFLLLIPLPGRAAVLYLEPSEGEYYQRDTFIVKLKIDTEGECINTVDANLSFSQDILEAIDFSKGSSILIIWLKEPTLEQNTGRVSFAGGIPGGYCGKLPGDLGESNLLGKIIFKAKEFQGERFSAKVNFLESSQALLNDGFGTPAKLKTKEAIITILSGITETPKKEWQEELEKDIIPPEPFEIELSKDPSVFEGKNFITFATNDKQTGIDYYEVQEGWKDWKKAESPYLLENQRLTSIIKVRAIDKAGNERIAEKLPEKKALPYWVIILILISAGLIWWAVNKFKMKRVK